MTTVASPRFANPIKTKSLKSSELQAAFDDFILSRKAMRCSASTLEFYGYTARVFLLWAEQMNVSSPSQLNAKIVRGYLAELVDKGKSDWTINDNARGIRTLLMFWHNEGYIPAPIKFQMPKIAKKRLPSLNAKELGIVLAACTQPRDKAIILLLADTGLRRSEALSLTWNNLDMTNGLCRLPRGKGGKARSVVFGEMTRQALIEYKNTLGEPDDDEPVILSKTGSKFTQGGFLLLFRRLSARTGIHITPHALRRTFVKLSLRSKMSPLHLKDLLGHESLEMVMHYAQEFDEEDLIREHREHGPIDNLLTL